MMFSIPTKRSLNPFLWGPVSATLLSDSSFDLDPSKLDDCIAGTNEPLDHHRQAFCHFRRQALSGSGGFFSSAVRVE